MSTPAANSGVTFSLASIPRDQWAGSVTPLILAPKGPSTGAAKATGAPSPPRRVRIASSSPGKGEVEAVDQPRLEQARKPPERGFRLARAGFRFENEQLLFERKLADELLLRPRAPEPGDGCKAGAARNERPQSPYVETDVGNCFSGLLPGLVHVVGIECADEVEDSPLRPKPVGERHETAEQMLETWRRRQLSMFLCKGLWKPSVNRITDLGRGGNRILERRHCFPALSSGSVRFERAAVMGERRE